MLTADRRPSRSIVANHCTPFVRLFNPDREEKPEWEDLRPIHHRVKSGKNVVSLALKLTHTAYRNYRPTRLQKNPRCAYCGCKVKADTSNIDHVLPESRGGQDWPANLLLTCTTCNSLKASSTLSEWLQRIQSAISQPLAIAQNLQALIDAGLESCLPVPKMAPQIVARLNDPSVTVKEDDFRLGRRWFHIVRFRDNKTLIRGLRGTDLRHYLDAVGFDNDGPLRIMACEAWHPICGDQSKSESTYPQCVASD